MEERYLSFPGRLCHPLVRWLKMRARRRAQRRQLGRDVSSSICVSLSSFRGLLLVWVQYVVHIQTIYMSELVSQGTSTGERCKETESGSLLGAL